jgi:hypothetical protein
MVPDVDNAAISDHNMAGARCARQALLRITHVRYMVEGGVKKDDEMSVHVVESHLHLLLPVR